MVVLIGLGELRSMAFPSAVTKAGWDLGNFDTAVNVDRQTVSVDLTVSSGSGVEW